MGRRDAATETLIPQSGGFFDVAHAFDARQSDVIQYGDRTGPLDTDGHSVAVAFQTRGSNLDVGKISGTIGTNADRASGSAPMVALAPTITSSNDPSRSPQSSEVTQQVEAVHRASMQVRRLTPRECERLQGFPDDWTLIPWRGRPAAECPDGPRYKALGNSMAVPCMRWLGQRIAEVSS